MFICSIRCVLLPSSFKSKNTYLLFFSPFFINVRYFLYISCLFRTVLLDSCHRVCSNEVCAFLLSFGVGGVLGTLQVSCLRGGVIALTWLLLVLRTHRDWLVGLMLMTRWIYTLCSGYEGVTFHLYLSPSEYGAATACCLWLFHSCCFCLLCFGRDFSSDWWWYSLTIDIIVFVFVVFSNEEDDGIYCVFSQDLSVWEGSCVLKDTEICFARRWKCTEGINERMIFETMTRW